VTAGELEGLAQELGLDAIGAAPAEPYAGTERHIRERRARGLFADMRFTMARPEESCHPETLLPGARTVVSAALCYWFPEPERPEGHGRLPRYTWFDAYAQLRQKLDELGRRLGGSYRVLVDANQHVDREAAARSGVGFYGKNTLLITRRHGSWVVLGTLVTDVELEATPPLDLDCGECRLCIDACPTGALDEPGTLDSTRCLSYWTQASALESRRREAPGRRAAARGRDPACVSRGLAALGARRAAKPLRAALRAAQRRPTAPAQRSGRSRQRGWRRRTGRGVRLSRRSGRRDSRRRRVGDRPAGGTRCLTARAAGSSC
jgi:epoxyqueuosine reductase QueG